MVENHMVGLGQHGGVLLCTQTHTHHILTHTHIMHGATTAPSSSFTPAILFNTSTKKQDMHSPWIFYPLPDIFALPLYQIYLHCPFTTCTHIGLVLVENGLLQQWRENRGKTQRRTARGNELGVRARGAFPFYNTHTHTHTSSNICHYTHILVSRDVFSNGEQASLCSYVKTSQVFSCVEPSYSLMKETQQKINSQ